MTRRWLVSAAICAVSVLGVRGWSARPAKAETLVHVAELAGGDLRNEVTAAQLRYLRSQPHHWRQVMGQSISN
jgi:hypothetical protein